MMRVTTPGPTAYTTLGANELMNHMMSLIPGGQWGALAFMLVVLLLLGMVLDPVGIMLITLPVFLPVVQSYGWDAIWFGVIFISPGVRPSTVTSTPRFRWFALQTPLSNRNATS